MAREQRRLAAVVSADVAGYSSLMGRDECRTLDDLKAHRRELIDPRIAEHGGRIVKTTGDGLLLEFPSVVDAVRCGVDVQRGMFERNAGVPTERRIEFRIGINVGDIIIDDGDIFGDGVNVAARLQTLAEPGGICVSRVVRDQVLDKLSFTFEELGTQHVKNIARPVEAYRVALEGRDAARSRGREHWHRLTRPFRWRWLAMSVLAVGVAGMAAWTVSKFWGSPAAPGPPPLSVAVIPFSAPGDSVSDQQFAEAVSQDLTSALGTAGRSQGGIFPYVLAAKYKGTSIDVRSAGRELDVRYLVEGEIKRAGEQVTVNLQLIDAGNSTQVWSDLVEFDQAWTTREKRESMLRIATRLYGALYTAEIRRAAATPAPGASAVEIALHADAVQARENNTLIGAREARKWIDQALQLDPSLVRALVAKAWTLDLELNFDSHADHDRLVQDLDELTFRAVSIDSSDPPAWWFRAESLLRQRRWGPALEANTKAQKLFSPISAWPLIQRAQIMNYMGQPLTALSLTDQALALNVQGAVQTGLIMLERCRASLALGRYDDAITACEKEVALDNWWLPHLYLLAAYAQQGQARAAAAEKVTLLKLRPNISIGDVKALQWSDDPAYLEQAEAHLFSGLRKAGISEN